MRAVFQFDLSQIRFLELTESTSAANAMNVDSAAVPAATVWLVTAASADRSILLDRRFYWQKAAAPPLAMLGLYASEESGGVARYRRLVANWRVATVRSQTADEYGVLFRNLFAMKGMEARQVAGIIISSVVPPIDSTLREACERYFSVTPLFVEPGVKTGMPVHYDRSEERRVGKECRL